MKCLNCGSEIPDDVNQCTECGHPVDALPQQNGSSWYDNGWWLLFWFLLFFPVAMYGIYQTNRFSTRAKQIMLGGFLVLLVAGILTEPEPTSTGPDHSEQKQKQQERWQFDTTVAYEDGIDTPIKAQVEQRIFVSGKISEKGLRQFLEYRYQNLLARSGFTHHDHPTNVFVYVFGSEDRAERGGTGWMGAVMKGASDKEPTIQVKPDLIQNYLQGPEERFGLKEQKRREIFQALVRAEDRADEKAYNKYPNDTEQQTDLLRKLTKRGLVE